MAPPPNRKPGADGGRLPGQGSLDADQAQAASSQVAPAGTPRNGNAQSTERVWFAPLPPRAIADATLSALDLRVLACIALHDRMSARRGKGQGCTAGNATLIREIGCPAGSLSRSLGRLEAAGYIDRTANPNDRRQRVYRVIYTAADAEVISGRRASARRRNVDGSVNDHETENVDGSVNDPAPTPTPIIDPAENIIEQNQYVPFPNIFPEGEIDNPTTSALSGLVAAREEEALRGIKLYGHALDPHLIRRWSELPDQRRVDIKGALWNAIADYGLDDGRGKAVLKLLKRLGS